MINWQLIKHPMNWAVIILMVVLAAAAGHLALSYAGIEPATANDGG